MHYGKLTVNYHPGAWNPRENRHMCCYKMTLNEPGCTKASPPEEYHHQEEDEEAHVQTPKNADSSADVSQSVFRKGTYVTVLYDYRSTLQDELDISRGEVLEILEEPETGWVKVRHNSGRCGYIPSNYVAFPDDPVATESHVWFYDVPRVTAEIMLKSDGREGAYLVRKSNKGEKYVLSVFMKENSNLEENLKSEGSVLHYQINEDHQGMYYILPCHKQKNIARLIQDYSQSQAELATRLRFYVNQRPSPATACLIRGQISLEYADLHFEEKLGTGEFGEVWKATYKNSTEVAVKKSLQMMGEDKGLIEEAKTMAKLNHECLVKLYGICTKPYFCIITEYMEGGSLLNYLRTKSKLLSHQLTVMLDTIKQVASGMAYLEANKVIHRDLAARNCLVRKPYQVKVADFGLSRFVNSGTYIASLNGRVPLRWLSPEAIKNSEYSSKSDIWAFGVLAWEVFTGGEQPYDGKTTLEVLAFITQNGILHQPKLCPSNVYSEVMLPCWFQNPTKRPTFADLLTKIKALIEENDQYQVISKT